MEKIVPLLFFQNRQWCKPFAGQHPESLITYPQSKVPEPSTPEVHTVASLGQWSIILRHLQ